ncbi:MAG: DUF3179 domain-containing protein [Chitinophagales bacterium]|nr:DUF3179 domain-containing protein [Chitinophagales bacterium]
MGMFSAHRLFCWKAMVAVAFMASCQSGSQQNHGQQAADEDSLLLSRFSDQELRTHWEKALIDLQHIKPGGPKKNDIPAIDFPEFVSAEQVSPMLQPIDFGVLLTLKDDSRFYPFRILNWHEIVNDVVGGQPVAVTFCPLCGSALVFDRVIDGDTLQFGVSGLLYESNLLMFDEQTESLWLQASGQCVVGDHAGKRLRLINSVVLTFEEVLQRFPRAGVLHFRTGYDRDYLHNPYVDYEHTDELYFPVSRQDSRFANKDMMYVVSLDSLTVAFHWKSLVKKGQVQLHTPAGTVEVRVSDYLPQAVLVESGQPLAGYFSYWFSWYAVHAGNGRFWPDKL